MSSIGKFTAHNVEFRAGATTTDYTETAKVSSVTVREQQGANWYRLEVMALDGRGGRFTARHRFARDGARLQWTHTLAGSSTTVPICRG